MGKMCSFDRFPVSAPQNQQNGTSVRALAEYLGHADPGFTLRTYTHLMPQAEDKAKRAVDDAFDRLESLSIDVRSVPVVSQGTL